MLNFTRRNSLFLWAFTVIAMSGCVMSSSSPSSTSTTASGTTTTTLPVDTSPAVTSVRLSKNTLTLYGKHLSDVTSVKISSDSLSSTSLTINQTDSNFLTATVSSALSLVLGQVYTLIVTNASASTTATFSYDLSAVPSITVTGSTILEGGLTISNGASPGYVLTASTSSGVATWAAPSYSSISAATFTSTVAITGATTLSSTLGVTGATSLRNLTVSGTSTFSGPLTLSNTVKYSGSTPTVGYVLTAMDSSGTLGWASPSTTTFVGSTTFGNAVLINGAAKLASTFQLTSGASAGYVLTSDSSGYGSWTVPSLISDSAFNTKAGTGSLSDITSGSANSGYGYGSLYSITSGINNTATGYGSLSSNTTGNNNMASGYSALLDNVIGSNNSAAGAYTLESNSGGSFNSALGYYALNLNTTGTDNSAFGDHALSANTTGGSNTAVGEYANSTNTTGTSNTAVGANSGVASGALDHATALGADAKVSTSNTIALGRDSSRDYVVVGQTNSNTSYAFFVNGASGGSTGWTNASDIRFKSQIEPIEHPLQTLEHLQGVTFDWKPTSSPFKFEKGRQMGFIAQQVEPFVPEVVRTDSSGYKGIQYGALVALVVESIKELSTEIHSLVQASSRHESDIEFLKKENALLKSQLQNKCN